MPVTFSGAARSSTQASSAAWIFSAWFPSAVAPGAARSASPMKAENLALKIIIVPMRVERLRIRARMARQPRAALLSESSLKPLRGQRDGEKLDDWSAIVDVPFVARRAQSRPNVGRRGARARADRPRPSRGRFSRGARRFRRLHRRPQAGGGRFSLVRRPLRYRRYGRIRPRRELAG